MTISNDLLRANRAILERRLRDLGLLVGVNDAEAMKHLRPRFEPRRRMNMEWTELHATILGNAFEKVLGKAEAGPWPLCVA